MTKTIGFFIALGVAIVAVGALLDVSAVALAVFAAFWFAFVGVSAKWWGRKEL